MSVDYLIAIMATRKGIYDHQYDRSIYMMKVSKNVHINL